MAQQWMQRCDAQVRRISVVARVFERLGWDLNEQCIRANVDRNLVVDPVSVSSWFSASGQVPLCIEPPPAARGRLPNRRSPDAGYVLCFDMFYFFLHQKAVFNLTTK